MVTLPKPGKSLTTLANFRSISLLNADLNIYAKILVHCLDSLLLALIGPDQVGFVRSRQAPDCTSRFVDLMQIAERCSGPSLLLSLDAEKAFNHIHWGYLWSVLQAFGLIKFIEDAIMALYTNPKARVSFISHYFCTGHGALRRIH